MWILLKFISLCFQGFQKYTCLIPAEFVEKKIKVESVIFFDNVMQLHTSVPRRRRAPPRCYYQSLKTIEEEILPGSVKMAGRSKPPQKNRVFNQIK